MAKQRSATALHYLGAFNDKNHAAIVEGLGHPAARRALPDLRWARPSHHPGNPDEKKKHPGRERADRRDSLQFLAQPSRLTGVPRGHISRRWDSFGPRSPQAKRQRRTATASRGSPASHIACNLCAAIVEAGAIPALALLLATSQYHVTKEDAAATLSHLTNNERHASAVVRAGAIPLLVALLQNGTNKSKARAAAILSSLTRNHHAAIIEALAIPALAFVVSDSVPKRQKNGRGSTSQSIHLRQSRYRCRFHSHLHQNIDNHFPLCDDLMIGGESSRVATYVLRSQVIAWFFLPGETIYCPYE